MQASDLAEAVRASCLEAAVAAWEDAGIQGLCAEGRWEAAMAAIQRLDVAAIVSREGGSRGRLVDERPRG